MDHVQHDDISEVIRSALAEDIGDGDVTSSAIVSLGASLSGRFVGKESGIVAGIDVAAMTFVAVDESIRFTPWVRDGGWIVEGEVLAAVQGPARGILTAERVVLNFLQRMSGIATMTRKFVDAVWGTKVAVLDTRKTAPGLRVLDKWAVRLGGGQNHRMGLYDIVLIKENHIAVAGGITEAVSRVRRAFERQLIVEVEVKNLQELREALGLRVDRILLDNMSTEELADAVRIAAGRIPLEASRRITLDNVAAIAATGVDYISVGALTRSVKALDISFLVESSR